MRAQLSGIGVILAVMTNRLSRLDVPAGHSMRSISAGPIDLLKEPLRIDEKATPVEVQITLELKLPLIP